MIEDNVNYYLNWIREATDNETRELRRSEFHNWYFALTEAERLGAQKAMEPHKEKTKAKLIALQQEAELVSKGTISYEGKDYVLGEWVTLSDYARMHNIQINRLTNWISRKIVPPTDVKIFPELNHLKLLRNKQYK